MNNEERELLKTIRQHFLRTVVALSETVEINTRMDIRDRIAALTLIDRVLAREKPDESERAGSAVRKYAPEFQKAYGAGRRATTTGQLPDEEYDEPDRAADGGEPADSDWEANDPRA